MHLCSGISTTTSIASMSIFAVQDCLCKCSKRTQLNDPLRITAMNTSPEPAVPNKRSLRGNGIIWFCMKVWHSKTMCLKNIIVPYIYIYTYIYIYVYIHIHSLNYLQIVEAGAAWPWDSAVMSSCLQLARIKYLPVPCDDSWLYRIWQQISPLTIFN